MQKMKYLVIALVCMVVQGAWAQTWTEVGDKDALNTAVQTDGANITLTADIALSNYLGIGDGSSSTPTVTIDLNGHTLSRSLDAADTDGHVIWVRTGSTLTVTDGSGNNSGKITGGWASNGGGICNYGTLYFQSGTITGCQTDYTGGAIRNNGTATISGCVFKGSLLNSSTTDWGGFVGWTESNNSATVSIANSLFIPTTVEGTNGATFARYRNSKSVTITDCYYTSTLGTAQGTQGYTVTSGTDGLTLDYGTATTTYEYNGIEVYSFDQGNSSGLLYGDKLYAASGKTVTFNVSARSSVSNVAASAGTLYANQDGSYTLVMTTSDAVITADMVTIELGDANGDGTVSMSDVIAIISYILGENPSPFYKDAADMNDDGEVTVTDVSLLLDELDQSSQEQ